MSYNPQKHHRRSIRLKHYDYASEGLYFVTLICDKRTPLFGSIKNGIMCLNEYGRIAVAKWLESIEIRPNISLGEYIIMPDHMHGIISIDNAIEASARANCIRPDDSIEKGECNSPRRQPLIGPSHSIGAIIRGYKGSVTKAINQHRQQSGYQSIKIWQRNYYEHVIRDERAYENISNYIINNPAKWTADRTRFKGESHSPRQR